MYKMNLRNLCGTIIAGFLILLPVKGQDKDKAIFTVPESGFYQNSIMKDERDLKEQSSAPKVNKELAVDLSGYQLPNKKDLYKNQQWHNTPVSQGNTGTCWCFSTTSFLESEVYRINKMKVKLSEMYTVYWEYVEKAHMYVQKRGNSLFDEGSEGNAVTRIWKKYGIVPESDYPGLGNGRKFHNHADMMTEMKTYLESLKTNSAWDEETAIATIKSIMNHYMGEPPAEIMVDGKKVTPWPIFMILSGLILMTMLIFFLMNRNHSISMSNIKCPITGGIVLITATFPLTSLWKH